MDEGEVVELGDAPVIVHVEKFDAWKVTPDGVGQNVGLVLITDEECRCENTEHESVVFVTVLDDGAITDLKAILKEI